MNRIKAALVSRGRMLPRGIRRRLVNAALNIDRAQFERAAHLYCHAPHMRYGLESLRDRGFSPRSILDIGAFEGEWTRMAQAIWPESKTIMFEANEQKYERLDALARETGGRLERALLGSEANREVVFHVMESGSSVFEEHSPVEREQVTRRVKTLDSLVRADDHPDLIKIDVQGYELEVLNGGLETLARAKALIIEISLLEINEGAPILHEVLTFMAEHGFVTYDILEIHRRPLDRATNQIDLLFVPAISLLRADKRHWIASKS